MKNLNRTANEAGLEEIIEVILERESASDGAVNIDVLPTELLRQS